MFVLGAFSDEQCYQIVTNHLPEHFQSDLSYFEMLLTVLEHLTQSQKWHSVFLHRGALQLLMDRCLKTNSQAYKTRTMEELLHTRHAAIALLVEIWHYAPS